MEWGLSYGLDRYSKLLYSADENIQLPLHSYDISPCGLTMWPHNYCIDRKVVHGAFITRRSHESMNNSTLIDDNNYNMGALYIRRTRKLYVNK